jgi:uncharacterized membrane protein YdjX (TVP38/TMEM64 family)
MRPAQSQSQSRLSTLGRVIGLVFVFCLTVGIALNRDRMQDFETLGYIGAFLAMLLSNATLILPAPGLIIVFALGSSLNPILVGLAGAVGATLGEITGYITGLSGVTVMEHTTMADRIRGWMNHNGPLTIFALSVVPNPFFDLAGVMAGAVRMPLFRFLMFAFLGKSIQSVCIALAGALSLDWVKSLLSH